MAASKKKNENDKWEAQFAEFDDYDGMPESSSLLHNWKRNQLTGFDGNIKEEMQRTKGFPYEEMGERDWRVASRGRKAPESLFVLTK